MALTDCGRGERGVHTRAAMCSSSGAGASCGSRGLGVAEVGELGLAAVVGSRGSSGRGAGASCGSRGLGVAGVLGLGSRGAGASSGSRGLGSRV